MLKLREAAWAHEIMAVPFGSPVFCCYYRADLLEKLGRRPPQTWAEYQDLAKLLAEKGREERGEGRDWCGTIEPLAPGWAGLVLLARAAPYAKHRDNYSTLFNIDTMEPLVAGPPFVQALEELIAAAKFGPSDPFRYDPAAARAAFWKGQCGMTLTWPTAANDAAREKESWSLQRPVHRIPRFASGFVELPGSRRVFNLSESAWDTRADDDDPRVPLLAIAGRLGVVNAEVGPRPGRVPTAAVALRQPHESADERGQSGDHALSAVEPKIARPMGGETGLRPGGRAVRRRDRGRLAPRAVARRVAIARPG